MKRKHAARKSTVVVLTALVIAGALFSASPSAAGEQFKFTVPVQVKNLSLYATGVRLTCGVKDGQGNFFARNNTVPNSGTTEAKLDSTGSFSGTLSDGITLMDPANAANAKGYTCYLMVAMPGISKVPEDCPQDTAFFCLKPGTPRTLKVEGTVN